MPRVCVCVWGRVKRQQRVWQRGGGPPDTKLSHRPSLSLSITIQAFGVAFSELDLKAVLRRGKGPGLGLRNPRGQVVFPLLATVSHQLKSVSQQR